MFIEDPMRSPLLLTFRAHRKQPCWFVDHNDGIIQMNNFEALALKGVVAPSLSYRNGHDIVRPQLGIMPDARLVLYRHRPEPEKVFRLFARQSQRQANQIWQELASGGDTKLMVLRHHVRFFSLCFDRTFAAWPSRDEDDSHCGRMWGGWCCPIIIRPVSLLSRS